MSGRRIGTSCAALTFFMLMICVTISSDVLLTSFGRSLAGNWRASVFGTILMTLPAGTATYPYTCSTDRNAS